MKKILILFLIFINCQSFKNDNVIINVSFKNKLSSYIETYPIKDTFLRNDIDFPHPCYEVFFDEYKNDTIVSIKLAPSFVPFNPLDFEKYKENDSLLSVEKIPLGYFLFKNQPVIIFDENNLSNKILKKENLKNNIPDSLKWDFGKANVHLKSKSEFYKLTKLELNKIEL